MVLGMSYAQNTSLGTIDTHYVTLPEDISEVSVLLKYMGEQTPYAFLYANEMASLRTPKPFVAAGRKSLQQLLTLLNTEFSVKYTIQDGTIFLKREAPASVVEFRIYGKVTDEDHIPVYGANILVKGTNKGIQTDFEGEFTLMASVGDVLEITYVGMQTVTVKVADAQPVLIGLKHCAEILSEVMVTGYGTQVKKNVTTAIDKVTPEDFNKGMVTSPLDLITGKVAGLTITNTANNPNSGVSIQLRGVTSIQGGTSPLIVIDGIPGGNVDLVQPNDIESFDVLKDGAAAAVYGTRGNNGVILITTKHGKKGKPVFEYVSFLSKDYEDKKAKPDFLSAADWRALMATGKLSAGLDHGASTDIWDRLINTGNLSQYHTFAAGGGGDSNLYRVSFYYNALEGIALENSREEVGGRIHFEQKGLNNRLMLQAAVSVNHNDANLLGGGDFGTVIDWNPTDPIYAEPSDTNPGLYGYYEVNNRYNPIARYSARLSERQQLTLAASTELSYEILKGLTLSTFGAYQYNDFKDRQYRTTRDWVQYQDGSEYKGTGYAYKSNYLNYTKLLESTLKYAYQWQENQLNVLAGYSYQYNTTEVFSISNSGFTSDATEDWDIGSGNSYSDPEVSSNKQDNTLIAFFSRLNYAYKDRYFFQASLRHEGSSRFGVNNKWGDFPSLSAGWLLSEENFIKGSTPFSFIKLRAGFGVTGNQDISNYQSLASLTGGYAYPIYYEGLEEILYYTTYGPSKNVNPNLKWETKEEFDMGLDFGLLKNRLNVSLDYYNRHTKDVLYSYAAQLPSGVATSILANVGNIRNNGFEVTLDWKILQTPSFSWSTRIVGSYQQNIVTSLSNDQYFLSEFETGNIGNPGSLGNAFLIREGQPIGDYYGKKFAGFTEDGKWLFYKADGSVGTSSEVSDDDNQIIGNGMPKYQASMQHNFRYKQFDLSVFLRGKFDYDILNTVDMFYGNPYIIGTSNVLRSALTTHKNINETPIYSSYYLERGDFVKIDNVSLGYHFPLTGKKLFSNLSLFASVRNLFTFSGYTGRDPEVDDTGLTPGMDDRSYYPRTKTITLGIKATF